MYGEKATAVKCHPVKATECLRTAGFSTRRRGLTQLVQKPFPSQITLSAVVVAKGNEKLKYVRNRTWKVAGPAVETIRASTRSNRLFHEVSSRRFTTRVQLGGPKFLVPFLPTSIRIQLSSFRNNCYRFPTAMLHFQLFTSKIPSLSPPSPTPSFLFPARTRSRLFSLSLLPLFPFVPPPSRSASPVPTTFLRSSRSLSPLARCIGVSFSPSAVLLFAGTSSILPLFCFPFFFPPSPLFHHPSRCSRPRLIYTPYSTTSSSCTHGFSATLCPSSTRVHVAPVRAAVYSPRFPGVRRAQARTQTRTPYAVLTENLPSPLHPRLGNMAASVAQLEEACACARRLQYH